MKIVCFSSLQALYVKTASQQLEKATELTPALLRMFHLGRFIYKTEFKGPIIYALCQKSIEIFDNFNGLSKIPCQKSMDF